MNKQNGSALIISLLMLMVMTLLGIASMSTSTLEEKMAANDRNQKVAFQNAEIALVDSETDVIDADWKDIYRKTSILGEANDPYYDRNETIAYNNNNTWAAGSCEAQSTNNCYVVQLIDDGSGLGDEGGKFINPFEGGYSQHDDSNTPYAKLNITAHSTDANNITTAIVQSTIKKLAITEP